MSSAQVVQQIFRKDDPLDRLILGETTVRVVSMKMNQQSHPKKGNRMAPSRTDLISTGTVMSTAPTFVFAGLLVMALIGCTSSNSVQIDAAQPVYFGTPPHSAVPIDSARVESIKSILVATSHISESGKSIGNETTTVSSDASERVVGDVVQQVGDALGNDTDRFISGGSVHATVETYIPLSTIVTYIFAGILVKNATASEGLGEASSETVEVSGNVYKVRRQNR
jgi:hypothetical protein